jgi:hypothetical protein
MAKTATGLIENSSESERIIEELLRSACHAMPALYASPDNGRLTALANRVLERVATVAVLRVANG